MPPRKPKAAPETQTGERLQKYMARSGIASRRAAEDLITQGRVEINGKVVTELGTRVDPDEDEVRLDGERLAPMRQKIVVLLNKPPGYLCAASDPEGRDLIYRLVPPALGLRSIGRLDFNTEGVLLLTNDGELAERVGHARYSVQRVYEARVRGVPTDQTLAQLVRGIRLDDGPARAETAQLIKQTESNAWVRLTLTEGRYREVRRMLERVGHPVVRLRRVAYAGLTLGGLRLGQWRMLDESEIEQLREKGHVGHFELPPDPRRKGQALIERPKLSARGTRGGARNEEDESPRGEPGTAAVPSARPAGARRPAASPASSPARRPDTASRPSARPSNRPNARPSARPSSRPSDGAPPSRGRSPSARPSRSRDSLPPPPAGRKPGARPTGPRKPPTRTDRSR